MVDIDTFTTAAANGDISRVKQMLKNGIDPNGINRYGRTAMQVMKMGCPDICRVLLNGGAHPDRQDGRSIALIHDLAREGHLDTLKVLVEVGKANINLRDGNDKQAIDLARENNYPNVADYLIRRSQATKEIKGILLQ